MKYITLFSYHNYHNNSLDMLNMMKLLLLNIFHQRKLYNFLHQQKNKFQLGKENNLLLFQQMNTFQQHKMYMKMLHFLNTFQQDNLYIHLLHFLNIFQQNI